LSRMAEIYLDELKNYLGISDELISADK